MQDQNEHSNTTALAVRKYLAENHAEDCRPSTETDDLVVAIREFEDALPGWWWSVCTCNLTRDASCGPDFRDARCSEADIKDFDEGFHCDGDGSLADALRDVRHQAQLAKERVHG